MNIVLPESINNDAKTIWEYMHLHQDIKNADALFVLCSLDIRVAEYAAELFKQGFAPWIIVSGGVGKLTEKLFSKPEAAVFADIMINAGVPEDRIIIEDKSTNTGENIRFTYEVLKNQHRNFSSFILVQKPYMERRTFATFVKQWPGPDVDIQVTSPPIGFEEYVSGDIDRDSVINIMVGDLQRIHEYPKLGYQVAQDIPADVWEAYERLVSAGYSRHLIS